MNIEEPINKFIVFCLSTDGQVEDYGLLLEHLDTLVMFTQIKKFEFDNTDYPEPPKKNYSEIRTIVSARFPMLGFYCTAEGNPESMEEAKILIGDAIDDLVDIITDLEEVLWYLENTSVNHSLWHFQFSFRTHWGLHARELQLHLHKQWW